MNHLIQFSGETYVIAGSSHKFHHFFSVIDNFRLENKAKNIWAKPIVLII
jgi:hypothetical protein